MTSAKLTLSELPVIPFRSYLTANYKGGL